MDQIPSLLQTAYRRCHQIQYKDLMLNTSRAQPISSRTLQDQVSNDKADWSFKDYSENIVLLQNSDSFLLRTIQQSKTPQRVFIDDSQNTSESRAWRESTMATYEAIVQDFLAALCVLFHISSGQPIREPEISSMIWRNTQRRRHITIRFSRVSIPTDYGKQQSQQGLYQDSVRFLAQPIGDLLLDHLVHVLPLRQRFARQSSPAGLPFPLLWERHGKNWRQITVAIVKTKFAGDVSYSDVDGVDDDEEEPQEPCTNSARYTVKCPLTSAPSSTLVRLDLDAVVLQVVVSKSDTIERADKMMEAE